MGKTRIHRGHGQKKNGQGSYGVGKNETNNLEKNILYDKLKNQDQNVLLQGPIV